MGVRSLAVSARGVAVLAAIVLLAVAGRAGATVITAFPSDFAVNEQSSYDGAVATFEDDDPNAGPADFTATIDWGDGSPTTPGTIAFNSGAFVVLGQHTYADEGSFTVTVTISDQPPGTGTATAASTATVNEADVLSGTPRTFSAPAGVSFTGTVADFTDTLTGNVASDFTATIDWGDATTSGGTVSGGSGAFQVSGTHTYAAAGTYAVQVTLSDDKPGTATATVTSTAKVAAGLAVNAVNITATEGTPFNGTVATFSDADTNLNAASFVATVNWGDGTTSAGTVSGASGSFTVAGQHTYADEGSFTTTVTVTETAGGGATASGSATATVAEADALSGSPVAINAQQGVAFTGTVATFTDAYTGNVASDFVATINWGDGNTTAGTVSGGGGAFTVTGTHTYAATGPFTVTVTLADDAPGTAAATVTSPANVTANVLTIPALDLRGLLTLALALTAAALYLLRKRGAERS
jgi:PKD repeat protein